MRLGTIVWTLVCTYNCSEGNMPSAVLPVASRRRWNGAAYASSGRALRRERAQRHRTVLTDRSRRRDRDGHPAPHPAAGDPEQIGRGLAGSVHGFSGARHVAGEPGRQPRRRPLWQANQHCRPRARKGLRDVRWQRATVATEQAHAGDAGDVAGGWTRVLETQPVHDVARSGAASDLREAALQMFRSAERDVVGRAARRTPGRSAADWERSSTGRRRRAPRQHRPGAHCQRE